MQLFEGLKRLLGGNKKSGSGSGIDKIRDDLQKAMKNIDVDLDLNLDFLGFEEVGNFFKKVGGSTLTILQRTPDILAIIPELLETGETLLEELPDFVTTMLNLSEKVILLVPRILEIVEKLLSYFVGGLEYTLDEKNKTIVMSFLVLVFFIWMVKDNSLI